MCGIIGYLGDKQALPIILEGLKRMEYRGYDSAGVALVEGDSIFCQKKAGKLETLTNALEPEKFKGHVGIGHIRWATHGAPTDLNAHPHPDAAGTVFVVHNGIVENSQQIKNFLTKEKINLSSETDTELIAQLIGLYYNQENITLEEAAKRALEKINGTYGLAVVSTKEPEKML